MAEAGRAPASPEIRERWGNFAWTAENAEKARAIVARYPAGRQKSAIIPLLDIAQRQVGAETETQGWLPIPVIEFVAAELGMPYIRAYEVATFYTMFNLAPVGRHHVQVCGTTPCMLRGSDDVLAACYAKGLKKGHITGDGMFTLTEVECLGACANAPMVQINDDNYEDLTFDSMSAILDDLAAGRQPKIGPQVERRTSCPEDGPTTLKEMVGGKSPLPEPLVRALAVLLALPAACRQFSAPAGSQCRARGEFRVVPPARNDLQVAEDIVRRQLGNPEGLGFANAVAHRDDRIAIVCGELTNAGRRERYIVVDGRAAWLESGMRPGEMDRAVREFCSGRSPLMSAIIGVILAVLAIFLLIKMVGLIFKIIGVLSDRGRRAGLSLDRKRIDGR